MTFKIDKTARGESIIFVLSGRIEDEQIPGLTQLLELETNQQRIVLDLREIKLVDRAAVRFLVRCEEYGIKIENPPAYVREWMERERG
jgi:anti-anti-sigma regulatory factor